MLKTLPHYELKRNLKLYFDVQFQTAYLRRRSMLGLISHHLKNLKDKTTSQEKFEATEITNYYYHERKSYMITYAIHIPALRRVHQIRPMRYISSICTG